MTAAESELARIQAERDQAKLLMEDLISLRSNVAMSGTEAELDAHDARFARAKRAYERAVAAIDWIIETGDRGPSALADRCIQHPPTDRSDTPARPKTS